MTFSRAAAALVVLSLVTPAPSSAAPVPPPEPVTWLATGDSYSAGEGSRSAKGDCQLSDKAYAPVARDRLKAEGFAVGTFVHAACTGHVIPQLFTIAAPNKGTTLYEWSGQLAAGARDVVSVGNKPTFDLVTLTFGGNDIGFAATLRDCIGGYFLNSLAQFGQKPEPLNWGDLGGINDGCDLTLEDIKRSLRETLTGGGIAYAPGKKGSAADFYVHLAHTALSPGGHVVVLGYPELFAASNTWEWYESRRCWGVRRADADILNEAGRELNMVLKEQVTAADARLSSSGWRISFVDVNPLFQTRRLCDDDSWINGLDEGVRRLRAEAAFHPNDAGYAAEAGAIADKVKTLDWSKLTSAPRLDETTAINLKGIGPVVAGMTVRQAEQAAGIPFVIDGFEDFEGLCYSAHVQGLEERFDFLVEARGGKPPPHPKDGIIGRVSVYQGMARPAKTLSGIGIGASKADVLLAYPGRITTEPHPYEPDGSYLTYVGPDPADAPFRLRFAVNDSGVVDEIHAGLRVTVAYLEGCVS